MGSRRIVVLMALALAAAVAAVPAAADPVTDARAAATRFLAALANSDAATACGLFSPGALERMGGRVRCEAAFSEDEERSADGAARGNLVLTLLAARKGASNRKGQYVRKGFGARELAREIERLAPQVDVKLGRGPQAAAGQLATTVVLDTRTSARRLVVYCESDDGSIWRLSAPARGEFTLDEVAQGVPESPQQPGQPAEPAFSFTINSAVVAEAGAVYVTATLSAVAEDGETYTASVVVVLVPSGGDYLVDDLLVSALAGG